MRQDHPILRKREELAASGRRGPWLALFDIDSTLMDTGPRNLAILEAALAAMPELEAAWLGLESEGRRLSPIPAFWNLGEHLRRAGIRDESLLGELMAFWRERFFTDEWLVHDRPYPGVAAFLGGLKAEGFAIAYLTGRHSSGMEAGTRSSFLAHGLPAGDGELFFFKPSFLMGDLEFKTSVRDRIKGLGSLVLSVDNEPANVNLFHRAFPEALSVWIDTVTAPQPEALLPGVERRGSEYFLDL